ncbi:MAG: capsule assembly Wzi family protein [Paludibacter sp.]|nr:capsule assembly Wzi family protein [Paludibacter sp.]
MYKIFRIIIFLLFVSSQIKAQNDTIKYDFTLMGLTSTGAYSPFWLHSRQYGKTSIATNSADFILGFNKEFGDSKRIFDYGFKADVLLKTDPTVTNLYFHELYAKARLFVFDLAIGSREEYLGNQDSTLSSGGLLFSQNTRPMPKITIGIEHFTTIPFTFGLLEIKGALSHGWYTDNTFTQNQLLHHKYAYLRLGGKFPVHFQYGLDHVAQWGGNVPRIGQQPISLNAYKSIFFGKSGGADATMNDQLNALGNHIISQSTRLDIDISDFKISGYWQNVSEDGPIRLINKTMNRPDGLWGISIRNKNFTYIKGILFEILNTTDQSGPYHDKDGIIYGGADSYFTNGIYQSGWTYYSHTIGTPFITSPVFNTNGNVSVENNRVRVHHVGAEGDISGYNYKILTSFSKNYGSYNYPYPEMKPSTSLLMEVNKQFPKLANINVGCSIGADFGKLYGNSVGCLLSIRKTGDLFRY